MKNVIVILATFVQLKKKKKNFCTTVSNGSGAKRPIKLLHSKNEKETKKKKVFLWQKMYIQENILGCA